MVRARVRVRASVRVRVSRVVALTWSRIEMTSTGITPSTVIRATW